MPSHHHRSSVSSRQHRKKTSLDSFETGDTHSSGSSIDADRPGRRSLGGSEFISDSVPNSPEVDTHSHSRRASRRADSLASVGADSISPRSQAVLQLEEQPSLDAGLETLNQRLDNIMPDTPSSPRRPSQVPPDARRSTDAASTSPNAATLRIPLPTRPTLNSVNSSTALLDDISSPNTPATPFTADPFASGSSRGPSPSPIGAVTEASSRGNDAEPVSSPEDVEENLAGPPTIKVNSIPNTPESADIPAFESRASFAAPFGNGSPSYSPTSAYRPGGGAGRMSQTAPSMLSKPSISKFDMAESSARTSALISATSNIAQRRSQRMKAGKASKKERESTDFKKPAGATQKRKAFQSTRLKGEIYKPWLEKKDPALRWARWITLASIVIGFGLAAFLCYNGYAAVPSLGGTCLVLDEDFSGGIDASRWQKEVRLDGYGHGTFDWTTAFDENSFVQDGTLYLVPTLTSGRLGEDAISNGYTLNLTTDGTCTSDNVTQCVAVSNSSRLSVINPVMSARLTTKNSVSLKYGKVEVKAKFPTGDWLWPSILMLPVNETYGAWPRSGQIDILTGRGNNASYPNRGVDYAQSDLHWGPNYDLDRLWMTWGYREQRRTYYNQKWHTYGLEWNDKFLWTYIDSRVSQVISLRFNKQSFWQKGKFPSTITNTTTGDITKLINPWISSEENNAPFDQPFYLVLSLAVGGIDTWFPDGEGGKPWLDNSGTAMYDFWNAKDRWWNNWPSEPTKRGFAIDSVKMWKTGSC